MKMKTYFIFFTLILIITISSCSKVGPEGPAGQTGPAGSSGTSLKGNLIGWLSIYDQYGAIIDDKSGVTVTVDGAVPAATATTNALGKFQIDSLKTGNYELVFSKTGYATRRGSLTFIGGSKPVIYNSYISQLTTTLATNLSVTYYSTTSVNISCTVAPAIPAGFSRVVRLFFGKTATVSSTNYLTSSSYTSSASPFSYYVTINKAYFPSGSTMYVIAYGDAYNAYSFIDMTSGLGIYATLNTPGSNVASYIVP